MLPIRLLLTGDSISATVDECNVLLLFIYIGTVYATVSEWKVYGGGDGVGCNEQFFGDFGMDSDNAIICMAWIQPVYKNTCRSSGYRVCNVGNNIGITLVGIVYIMTLLFILCTILLLLGLLLVLCFDFGVATNCSHR